MSCFDSQAVREKPLVMSQLALNVPVRSIFEMKARQAAKLKEIRQSVVAAGYDRLDQQAAVLGLSRSTAWTILNGSHKCSGLSAGVLARILASPNQQPEVRVKILEYLHDKSIGYYGGTKKQLRQFVDRLRQHGCCQAVIDGLQSAEIPLSPT